MVTVVSTSTGAVSNRQNFDVYEETPVINAATPSSIPAGTVSGISLSGTGFYSNSVLAVTSTSGSSILGGSYTIPSSTAIDYISPALQFGSYSMTVTNPGGLVSLPFEFSVTSVCGNSVVEGGETCDDGNIVSQDGCSSSCSIESSPPNSGPSGGGGSGGGGSSSSPQCNDGRDNDGDGLKDYPKDTGCSSKVDNSEANAPAQVPITGTPTPVSPSNSNTGGLQEDSINVLGKNVEFRLAYWIVIVVLGGGILVIAVLIVRTLRQRLRIINLANSTNANSAKIANFPPSSYGGTGGYN